jgi:hypothetical protein
VHHRQGGAVGLGKVDLNLFGLFMDNEYPAADKRDAQGGELTPEKWSDPVQVIRCSH